MLRKSEHPVRDIAAYGTAYIVVMSLLAFYPATVMMAYFGSMTEPGGMQKGFYAFVITLFIMALLVGAAKSPKASEGYRALCWILLIGLYLFCLPGLFHILDWVNNPTYPTYGTTNIPDYSSDSLPLEVHLLPYDGFWKDIFNPSLAQIWDSIKGPVLTVLVLLPFVMISKFFRKKT